MLDGVGINDLRELEFAWTQPVAFFLRITPTVGSAQWTVNSAKFSVSGREWGLHQLLITVHCFYGTDAIAVACTGSVPVALVIEESSLPAVVESNV